ncbi:hypothetical protein NPIL_185111 [Nephila pilipes]|uniref:Uncharacterized protein n=1 Tax=Nephila pilipes TaxID=299642 RepID=A0A8X6UGF9_NEPPI|nr:hypothetical protein NPIL_185111 [Nephila pilipes]
MYDIAIEFINALKRLMSSIEKVPLVRKSSSSKAETISSRKPPSTKTNTQQTSDKSFLIQHSQRFQLMFLGRRINVAVFGPQCARHKFRALCISQGTGGKTRVDGTSDNDSIQCSLRTAKGRETSFPHLLFVYDGEV